MHQASRFIFADVFLGLQPVAATIGSFVVILGRKVVGGEIVSSGSNFTDLSIVFGANGKHG